MRLVTFLSVLFLPAIGAAQQPLDTFLDAARTRALDVRAAEAAVDQARSQVAEARARLLPSFVAVGSYTRNQEEVAIQIPTGPTTPPREAVITPDDQLDARFTLTVPLIDVPGWGVLSAQGDLADAADARADVARVEVQIAVAQLWHQLVATRGLVAAAQRNLQAAQQSREAMAARVEVGAAAQLELARTEAEVARASQSLAEAELLAVLAARNIQDLTEIAPSPETIALADDLAEEQPLETWIARAGVSPAVRAARSEEAAAETLSDGAWTALLPTVAASATERLTNASGFSGQDSVWSATVSATWIFDFGRTAQIHTRSAAYAAARARTERAERQARTQIFEAWHRVRSMIARARAAEAAEAATRRAASDARARFETGAATQLEVIQADRDLFASEVARIQALADLGTARTVLRLRTR
jgi:outer membrane protein